MNIVIRTDASIEIGTGHVMRCLTLAKQLKLHGAKVTFICRELIGNSISYLRGEGMRVISLPVMGDHLEWTLDAQETIKEFEEMVEPIDLLIVDHYGLDQYWEKELRPYTRFIMVVDDLANRPHDCDLLLDQNYYLDMEKRYTGLVPNHCVQMLGPNYVLLRDEFLLAVNKTRKRTGEVKNILVFFGGTDPTGETIKTLNAIKNISLPNVIVNVVVGQSNPKRLEIEQMCLATRNVRFHCQINNMAELMNEADLAIGAGGSTTWERCYLKLPSLTIVVAENQRDLTKGATELGISINLGESSEVQQIKIMDILLEQLANHLQIKNMSNKCSIAMDTNKIKAFPVMETVLGILK